MTEKDENILQTRNLGTSLYIHIPFCKQACHYCDFHFSTSLRKKGELVNAICKELILRKDELRGPVQTIYFGGGTPSLLSFEELQQIFETIYSNFKISENPEITLEANPDDLVDDETNLDGPIGRDLLSNSKLEIFKKLGINRLSIGVQSFFEEDLKLMNRAHSASEAFNCIEKAKFFFENISIDLIYGIPGMSQERWIKNLEIAFSLNVPHLSCYALTVEPRTALKKFIDKGIVPAVDEEMAKEHYEILVERTEKEGFDNYEFSNFGRYGFYSRNNTAYWEGKSYLGIGPSAHSYNGKIRSWNVANNTKYIKSIELGILPSEEEILSIKDRYNEYIMTGLRTKKGVSLEKVESEFGKDYSEYLDKQAVNHLKNELLILQNFVLTVSKKGKFLSDGIASDLFMI